MSETVISQYDKRKEQSWQERTNSETFSLKLVNNLMKRVLISESMNKFPPLLFPSIIVVDLCGGKAGDLRKWIHSRRKIQYYLIDASQTEVERAERRFKEMTAEEQSFFEVAKFICADGFSSVAIANAAPELANKTNIISCQFAVHYAYESEPRSNTFWSTINWLSQPGTVLAMSHPIRQRVIEWCRAFSKKRKSINLENNLCSIHFVDPKLEQIIADSESLEQAMELTPKFGTCYRFSLHDALQQVPEFLLPPTKQLHQQAISIANMHCNLQISVDQKKSFACENSNDAMREIQDVRISTQEYQVACLYQYCLYCAKSPSPMPLPQIVQDTMPVLVVVNEPQPVQQEEISVLPVQVKITEKVTPQPRRSSRIKK